MTILPFSPEIWAAIGGVCRDPAVKIVSEIPSLDVERVEGCINKVLEFLRSYNSDLGEIEYILRINFDYSSSNGPVLNPVIVAECNYMSANTIILDSDLKLLSIVSIRSTAPEDISAYSREEECCLIHIINGFDIFIYVNGKIIKQLNVLSPLMAPSPIKHFSRSANDYKHSVIEFYKRRIRFAQHSYHWDPPGNRQQRILCRELAGKKTEMIFHENLWNWLEENLIGAAVFGSVKKLSDDETDIEIRLLGGGIVIIEIKWLGTNGNTPYGDARLRDGMIQVRNYLIREPSTKEACLVVFDGRNLEKFRGLHECGGEADQWKYVSQCLGEDLPVRGKCIVFFLENKEASKKK